MNIYVLDLPEGSPDRRNWEKMLPQAPRLITWRELERVDSSEAFIGPGVLIVHDRRTVSPYNKRDLFPCAARLGWTVVMVSGGGFSTCSEPASQQQVYYRKTPVALGLDSKFGDCFRRFWDALCVSGEPQFELLEPDSFDSWVLILLCEAWLIAHDPDQQPRLRAPNTMEAWLPAFGTDVAGAGGAVAALAEAIQSQELHRDTVLRCLSALGWEQQDRIEICSSAVVPSLVFGCCGLARALAQVCGCPLVERDEEDTGWVGHKLRDAGDTSMVLVLDAETPLGLAVRWHREVWGSIERGDARCVVFGLSEESAELMLGRDVFGRAIGGADTFSRWEDHTAIVERGASLSGLLERLGELVACPVETWRRHAQLATVLPQLRRAVEMRDAITAREVALHSNNIDWDAICSHRLAHEVVSWIATLTQDTNPNWEVAEEFLKRLPPN